MESQDPDVKINRAFGEFNIPAIENGKNILTVTSSLHGSGRDITKLNGCVITGNVDLGPGSSKITLDVDPNVDLRIQLKSYTERKMLESQSGQSFNYHNTISPGLNFSVNQYQMRNYLKQHYYFFGIRTIRRLAQKK